MHLIQCETEMPLVEPERGDFDHDSLDARVDHLLQERALLAFP